MVIGDRCGGGGEKFEVPFFVLGGTKKYYENDHTFTKVRRRYAVNFSENSAEEKHTMT